MSNSKNQKDPIEEKTEKERCPLKLVEKMEKKGKKNWCFASLIRFFSHHKLKGLKKENGGA